MNSVYILVAVILATGGIIGSVGERFEKRVRKQRLSLFSLRPKHTILLIAFFTGVLISASTLFIVYATDAGLRSTVFQIDALQQDISTKQEELNVLIKQIQIIENS
ncbi:hypothetical protein NIES4071_52780 [Calothrix sp. NIES-4071]|nr:hypothetical protein NIES4071_52780 [Calothrix sp. NIES-4071]BAZ59586.1 hypothetical protein NIES4105_52730 [Calothrix sp. NIES-4105]